MRGIGLTSVGCVALKAQLVYLFPRIYRAAKKDKRAARVAAESYTAEEVVPATARYGSCRR